MLKRQHFLFIAPALALICYGLLSAFGFNHQSAVTAAITLLTVVLWVSEALPIPATSIIPFALLPMFSVVDHKTVSSALGSHVILLLMGAFMLSKALEKSGAHERLAVYMVRWIGTHSGKRLILGFMLTAAFLSMWISNTATVLIMLPMALALLNHVDNDKLKVALILGIAYASSVGGVGTLIGTPPNVIFAGIYEEQTGIEFGFLEWMKIGIPVVLLAVPLMALWLSRGVHLSTPVVMPKPGAWRVEEKRALTVFAFTALAWVFRKEPFGGWTGLVGVLGIGDSTVALTAVVLMFAISNGKGGRLLDWQTAKTIPWDMLLLFAGGIAIAKGFVASGLSDMLGNWLASLAYLPLLAMLLILCWVVTYLTEITSNTATATLLMPVLAVAAISIGFDAKVLMIPAAICASCAFMLPVATAPNAIAYGTKQISIRQMVTEGALLSFVVSTLVALLSYLLLT
ncbi:DASS family sodium-coupled anion symporter [Thalassotalea maritima]|uniref:SLC13 family permease n=1 Tax=Thalassotalea maritima TaxID=3242416 RepID=UPI0035281A75